MKIEIICPQDGSIILTFYNNLGFLLLKQRPPSLLKGVFFFHLSGYWKLHIAGYEKLIDVLITAVPRIICRAEKTKQFQD